MTTNKVSKSIKSTESYVTFVEKILGVELSEWQKNILRRGYIKHGKTGRKQA